MKEIRHGWRRAPITLLVGLACILVDIGTRRESGWDAEQLWRSQRDWGAVVPLTWVSRDASHWQVDEPALHGPFDLWDGQWWRVPLSALHHGGFWHLGLNLLGAVCWGPLLERRWGAWRYALFLIGAAFVSMVPEFLLDNYVMGYSGVLCAIFGALIVMRRHDDELARQLPWPGVRNALILLAAMIPLTALDVLRIANVAHFSGLFYGAAAAWCCSQQNPLRSWLQPAFVLAHLGLIAPYWAVTHPVWNARYHWQLALSADGQQRRDAVARSHLDAALRRDPSLATLWRDVAAEQWSRGERLVAWKSLLQGLRHNPSDAPTLADCRKLWRRLSVSPEREAALAELAESFGERSETWLVELRRIVPPPVLIGPGQPPRPTKWLPPSATSLSDGIAYEPPSHDWPWERERSDSEWRPDPERPDSALEGMTL